MFDGLHHAREHLSGEMPLYILRLLTGNYGKHTAHRASGSPGSSTAGASGSSPWSTRTAWSTTSGGDPYRSWRKNRQPNPGSSVRRHRPQSQLRLRLVGRRLRDPASINYRGPAPFSAPETQAIRDFVLSRRVGGLQRIRTHISFHTAGEFVLWPYGHTHTDVPPDMTRLDELALRRMGRHMAATQRLPADPVERHVPHLRRRDRLAVRHASGSSATRSRCTPPPRTPRPSRHYPPDELIGRETRRNREAVLYLMEQADCPYRAIGRAASYCGPLYDDLEVARGWAHRPGRHATRRPRAPGSGAIPAVRGRQLGSAISGRAVLVTGRARGRRCRWRPDHHPLTVGPPAVGQGRHAAAALLGGHVRRRRRPTIDSGSGWCGRRTADVLATRSRVTVRVGARTPRWTVAAVVASRRRCGARTSRSSCMAADTGADATVEAGVDDVRITRRAPVAGTRSHPGGSTGSGPGALRTG